ncbi:MAG TPA: PRC-barrel domain-containing protein [Thermoplasmata archaeon]|nr:PRC-barrel domain-containing protein [Thermoplasmata archaeon]
MLVESTELVGRQVYTPDGRLLGEVGNLVIDVDGSKIDGLFLDEPSGLLVEDSKPISVPFRWVAAVNDVVLLRFFPKRVSMKKSPARAPTKEAAPAVAPPVAAPAR